MTFRRFAVGVVAVGATSTIVASSALVPAVAVQPSAQVSARDQAGDHGLAKQPKWMKKTARAKEADLRNVKVVATADTLTATFKVAALKRSQDQKTGPQRIRGKYHRHYAVKMVSHLPEYDITFVQHIGYEESRYNRHVSAKPRVFVEHDNGWSTCHRGKVSFKPKKKLVTITIPLAKCFGGNGVEFEVSALSRTFAQGPDGKYRDFASDEVKLADKLVIPEKHEDTAATAAW